MNLLAGVEQDFHRPQKSPGAYEWWHFDGTDDKSGYSFSIQFHAGNLFSAYYQDSLKTYWEKTKSPLVDPSQKPEAPNPSTPSGRSVVSSVEPSGQVPIPNPLDYCGVSFRLFYKGTMVAESLQEFSQKSLKASDKHGAVLLGPNRFNWDERGDTPSYVLTTQAPLQGGKTTVRARLFFTPRSFKVQDDRDPAGEPYFTTHTWVLAAPLCHVEGTLEWVNREGEQLKEVSFVGHGYHDHHFGTVPPERFVKSWHWGHVNLEGEDWIYSLQFLPEKNLGPVTEFISVQGNQARIWDLNTCRPPQARNIFWTPYEKRFELPEAHLQIQHQRILSQGPALSIFEDKADRNVNGGMIKGTGLSNHLYTPRLSSRFFFPLLKGKSLIIKPSEDSFLPPPSDDVSMTRPIV